jgi:hypothetical protein
MERYITDMKHRFMPVSGPGERPGAKALFHEGEAYRSGVIAFMGSSQG